MCTNITHTAPASGSAHGRQGWFDVREMHVSYDHPFHARLEHALNLDFVNEGQGLGARVSVELDRASARTLAERILAVLDEARDVPEGGPASRP